MIQIYLFRYLVTFDQYLGLISQLVFFERSTADMGDKTLLLFPTKIWSHSQIVQNKLIHKTKKEFIKMYKCGKY